MTTQVHLVVVGTSILRNALLQLGNKNILEEYSRGVVDKCRDYLRYCTDPSRYDRDKCRELSREKDCLDLLFSLVDNNPNTMSAELNTMDWVLSSNCSSVDKFILYASGTPEGQISADILRRYLVEKCSSIEVDTRIVEHLGREFWRGLLELVKLVREDTTEINRLGKLVYLNATGGFKPESGFILIAAMLSAPVAAYYRHEAMKQTVMLPPIPITIDKGRFRVLESILEVSARKDKIRLDDPQLAEIQWILSYLSSIELLEHLGSGYYRVTEKARELLKQLVELYRELYTEV